MLGLRFRQPPSSRRESGFTVPCAVLVALLAPLGTSASAQPGSPPAGSYLESVGVRLVNVGVLVTDKSGGPVIDLTVRDFELREDGKRVEITHFEGPATMGDGTAAAVATPGGDQGYVVLLVDNLATGELSRRRVLEGAREFLDAHLDSGLEFAIASYDGYLRVRQTFTRDPDLLHDALEGLEVLSALGLARRSERWAELGERFESLRSIRNLMLDPGGDNPSRHITSYTTAVRAYAERVGQETGSVLYAMSHMVNALGALPGRKALVYVSEGLPMRPGEEFLQAASDTLEDLTVPGGLQGSEAREASVNIRSARLDALSQSGSPTSSRRARGGAEALPGLEQLTAMANASRVSIYALKSDSYAAGVPPQLAGDVGMLYTPALEAVREQNLLETLQVMAARTGGDARVGTGIGSLLDRAQADLRRQYTLAFSPQRPADNGFHQLEVKVKRKKVDVRSRDGYIDKTIGAKLADRATTSLLLGIDDNPHGIRLEIGQVRPSAEKGLTEVALILHIPLRDLLLTETGGVYSASTQLFLAARDQRGDAAPVQALELRIETDHSLEDRPDQLFTGQLPLVLKSDSQRVGLAFVDPVTGSASFVSAELDLDVDQAG